MEKLFTYFGGCTPTIRRSSVIQRDETTDERGDERKSCQASLYFVLVALDHPKNF